MYTKRRVKEYEPHSKVQYSTIKYKLATYNSDQYWSAYVHTYVLTVFPNNEILSRMDAVNDDFNLLDVEWMWMNHSNVMNSIQFGSFGKVSLKNIKWRIIKWNHHHQIFQYELNMILSEFYVCTKKVDKKYQYSLLHTYGIHMSNMYRRKRKHWESFKI